MKVSIITVVLNNESCIEACINSVLEQDYRNIEYIVIDGGSTDGTIDIIRKHDEYISKWISGRDDGIYDAMNKGIELASGDLVGFINADDIYNDIGVIGNVVAVMRDSSVDGCYSDLVYVDREHLFKVVRYWRSRQYEPGLFTKGWVPAHPTFFVRREILNQYGGFDLRYKLAADFELMARLLEYHRIRSIYVPKIFVRMRVGGATNISIANIIKQNFEIFHACKKNNIKISLPFFFLQKIIIRLHQFYSRPVK